MKTRSIFLFIVLISGIHSLKAEGPVSPVETKRIDSIINILMKKYLTVGASIAIVDNNEIVFAKGYGYADRKNKIVSDENTVYGIGSITKTFTTMAIMKLRDEGKIDLDKPASFYLPELKISSKVETGEILKIRNLLSHTSGLTDVIRNYDMCSVTSSMWSVIDDLNKEVMVQPANWKWNYSNLGFDILGCIVERVSGEKYDDYIRKNIFDKVQMPSTTFALSDQVPNAAKGYLKDSIETAEPIIREMAAGRILSNVKDMGKFALMIINGGKVSGNQVIKASSIEEMEMDHLANITLNTGQKFGYGLFIEKMFNVEDNITGDGIGHGGDTYIYHASLFTFPKLGIGFVILTNSAHGSSFCNSSFIKLFSEYVENVKGIKLHKDSTLQYSPKALVSNINDIHEVEGIYRTGSDDLVKIKVRSKNKIIFHQKHGGTLVLKRKLDNTFSVKVRIFKVFTVKIKDLNDMYFAFEKADGHIYVKFLNGKRKTMEYVIVKEDAPIKISENWKKAVGKYKPINSCEGNMQGVPYELKITNDQLVLFLQFKDGMKDGVSFCPIDESQASVSGIDRGCGMTMKILSNGHLYFSGYEMAKEETK